MSLRIRISRAHENPISSVPYPSKLTLSNPSKLTLAVKIEFRPVCLVLPAWATPDRRPEFPNASRISAAVDDLRWRCESPAMLVEAAELPRGRGASSSSSATLSYSVRSLHEPGFRRVPWDAHTEGALQGSLRRRLAAEPAAMRCLRVRTES